MKIIFAVLLVLVASTAVFAAVGVSVEDDFFTPKDITIPAGTTVVWTDNGALPHTVTSGTVSSPSGLFDSGTLSQGQTFSFTFNTPGTFPYFCRFHGSMGMVGSVTVTSATTCATKTQLIKNPGFESGAVGWRLSKTGLITRTTAFPPHKGTAKAQLAANNVAIFQTVTIPSNACAASLAFYLRVATTETSNLAHDKLRVQIVSSSGVPLRTLATYSNLNKSSVYVRHAFNLLALKGKTVRIRFLAVENTTLKSTFLIDDVTLVTRH